MSEGIFEINRHLCLVPPSRAANLILLFSLRYSFDNESLPIKQLNLF